MDVGVSQGVATALLLGLAVGVLLLVALGGALLRWAVRRVAGFAPRYWLSCATFFAAMLASVAIQWALSFALLLVVFRTAATGWPAPGMALRMVAILAGFAIAIFALAGASALTLRAPGGARLPFAHALAAAAICICVGTVVYLLGIAAIVLVAGGVPGVMR
jgi:hypothetical protein